MPQQTIDDRYLDSGKLRSLLISKYGAGNFHLRVGTSRVRVQLFFWRTAGLTSILPQYQNNTWFIQAPCLLTEVGHTFSPVQLPLYR
jgi:hypothetical protein